MNWKIWPFSSDLNPIENVWGIIKMELEKKDLERENELIEAVKEAYNKISEDSIFNLVEFFQRRMKNVLKTMEIESLINN